MTNEELVSIIQTEESGKALHEEIARLEPQQRAVIRFRMDGLTTAQAGDAMGITRERARTLEGKALRTLRCSRKMLQAGRDLDIVCW